MKTSEQINEIAGALAKAQGAIQNPSKDAINPHFKSHYTDLAGGQNAIRAPFAANGLSYSQVPYMEGELLMLATRIMHTSGQWFEGDYPVCKLPLPPQQVGSAMTFAKRYSLFSMAGIAGEDDDGEEANKTDTPAPRWKARPRPPRDDTPFDDAPPERETDAAAYLREMSEAIKAWTGTADKLKAFWKEEEPNRERAGVVNGTQEYTDLFTVFRAKGLAIAEGK